ncbi:MAG: tryptophan synthase subunit alpha [Elusimicrobia bacterium]|nr:tryptophan synthase subunit alpha [Elusimicrobiota bacterium]
MHNRLEKKLLDLKRSGKKAFSLFLTAGFPSPEATVNLVCQLEKAGVDFFEIGFPFSDPIADGPTIQRSSEAALKAGMNWEKLMEIARAIRQQSDVPLIVMSYSNPLFCKGWGNAIRQLSQSGFDGAIVPDLVLEESRPLKSLFQKNNLALVQLLAPTSSLQRMSEIGKESSGFVYCVSVTGVTGARKDLPYPETNDFLKKARSRISLPILLGFGLSRPEQIPLLKGNCDGFILGSALIRVLENVSSRLQAAQKAVQFVHPFVREIGKENRHD